MGVSFVGEALHKLLALPVPASIYGLIIMMILLESGIVKFENIKDTGTFMLNIPLIRQTSISLFGPNAIEKATANSIKRTAAAKQFLAFEFLIKGIKTPQTIGKNTGKSNI